LDIHDPVCRDIKILKNISPKIPRKRVNKNTKFIKKMDNQALLQQTYNQIAKEMLGEGNEHFQMFAKPINFSWPVAPTGQESPQAYQLISIMPKWSDVASYDPGDARFFDAYKSVLSHLTFKVSPEKKKDMQDLKDQWTTANNEVSSAEGEINSAYQTQKQNGGEVFATLYPSITKWLEGPGSAWKKEVDVLTAIALSLGDDYNKKLSVLIIGNDPLADAVAALVTPLPTITEAPRGWTKVANAGGVLEWQPLFDVGTDGSTWRSKLTSGTAGAFTIELDASKSDMGFDKSWAEAKAEYNESFFGINAAGGWEKMNLNESDSSVKVEISVKASTLVEVTPGAWYNGGFVRDLFRNTGSGWTIDSGWTPEKLFGKDGLLSTRVNQLLVVYKQQFKITMSSSTYDKFSEQINVSLGLRIGPFKFEGSGGQISTKQDTTTNTTVITGGDSSDDPQIIGVTVAFPGK